MKKLSVVVASMVMVQACSGSRSSGSGTPQSGALDPLSAEIAAAPVKRPLAVVDDARPHVFTPRPHAARPRFTAAAVDISRLPALKTASCFTEADEEAMMAPQSLRRRTISGPAGTYGGGRGSSAAPMKPASKAHPSSAPKQKTAAPPVPAPSGEGYGYSFDSARVEAKREASQSSSASPLPQSDGALRVQEKERDKDLARAPGGYHDFGASIYLSNDDTMSLSSAQRVLYAIDRFMPIPREHVRPHELLNYFSFDTKPVAPNDQFSVLAEMEAKPGEPGAFTLALSVSGRSLSKEERRNAALTFVVDRSGSMQSEGRMDYLKRGLLRMTSELKHGDMVQLVLFDDDVCVPVEDFVVGRDPMHLLTSTIQRLAPRGSTDLDSGLRRGYALADRSYQPTHSNRVVLVTDALANTGVTDPGLISMISSHYDKRRIRLSGVGVGSEFNDGLLDQLTERGKGAYVFLGSEAEVDAVFGSRFISLIETVANDVHFQLHLPPSLGMNVFYGEESSTRKADVQAIHYFAGTSQLFLSDLRARNGRLRTPDSVMLSVEYEDAETGSPAVEEYAFEVGEIFQRGTLVEKGRLVMSFIDGLADTLQSSPTRTDSRAGGWEDARAAAQCDSGRTSLAQQARALASDPEISRVVSLWDKYCSRYQAHLEPVRRNPPRGADVWPSAQR